MEKKCLKALVHMLVEESSKENTYVAQAEHTDLIPIANQSKSIFSCWNIRNVADEVIRPAEFQRY